MNKFIFIVTVITVLFIGTWIITAIIKETRRERKKDKKNLEAIQSYINILNVDKQLAEGLEEEE